MSGDRFGPGLTISESAKRKKSCIIEFSIANTFRFACFQPILRACATVARMTSGDLCSDSQRLGETP